MLTIGRESLDETGIFSVCRDVRNVACRDERRAEINFLSLIKAMGFYLGATNFTICCMTLGPTAAAGD